MLQQILAAYPAAHDRFDELLEAPLKPRPHWQGVFAELQATTPAQLRERLAAAERQIRDSGVTYNVYADPQGLDRPWDLDVLPLIISPAEWSELEAGIAQRAELLNGILADLYGEQTLLRSALVPPSLILGHSGFLRPAHRMQVPGGIYLHVYAADLARSPDGRWWVLGDRTQVSSGAGYALENRLIVSRIYPALFRDLRIKHLAGFFATLRESLMVYSPKGDGPTLTVVLTPGPYNETYFEHALLARYLGFPLVEGGDLTARDGRIWLKTLGGLKRVHAILRRQDDNYCDPLELRPDSALGIAGLTDCARRGTVLIANSLGSGVLESGALLGFLPRLCEHLLGESLRLPSVATWWCGEPAALTDALKHGQRLVFKPADPALGFEPVFGQDLNARGLADLRQRVSADPGRYVAQELVRVSQAPVLSREEPERLGVRGVGLRVYAAATPGGGYAVMPGGLTRVAASADPKVVSMQRGGGSKDTWVMSPGPIDAAFTLLRTTVGAEELVRSNRGISSRVAENLFWFGRYTERCDDAARLLRLALNAGLQEEAEDGMTKPVYALVRAFGIALDQADVDRMLLAAATQESDPFGLAANLRQLARVAFNLRDRMSLDNWRTINRLIQDPVFGRAATLAETMSWLERTITGLMTLAGFALDGMTRDTGWRFLSIGRRLERLAFMGLALDLAFRESRGTGLGWLLELADSSVTYRSRYLSQPEWLPLLDLLVLDAANPRSLMFQAQGVQGYLHKLEESFGPCGSALLAPRIEALQKLDLEADLRPDNARLATAVSAVRAAAFTVSDRLGQRFFSHAQLHNRPTLAY